MLNVFELIKEFEVLFPKLLNPWRNVAVEIYGFGIDPKFDNVFERVIPVINVSLNVVNAPATSIFPRVDKVPFIRRFDDTFVCWKAVKLDKIYSDDNVCTVVDV